MYLPRVMAGNSKSGIVRSSWIRDRSGRGLGCRHPGNRVAGFKANANKKESVDFYRMRDRNVSSRGTNLCTDLGYEHLMPLGELVS